MGAFTFWMCGFEVNLPSQELIPNPGQPSKGTLWRVLKAVELSKVWRYGPVQEKLGTLLQRSSKFSIPPPLHRKQWAAGSRKYQGMVQASVNIAKVLIKGLGFSYIVICYLA